MPKWNFDLMEGSQKGNYMNRRVLTEGILILAVATVGVVEGLRLIIVKDPRVLYDIIGPGAFILFLSLALMVAGVYYILYYVKIPGDKIAFSREAKIRVISMSVALAIYLLLIDILGYYVSTILFLLTEFRLVGVKSWLASVSLSLVITAMFYIIFVEFLTLVFPKGILF